MAEYDTGEICGYCSYECYFSHRPDAEHEQGRETLHGAAFHIQ